MPAHMEMGLDDRGIHVTAEGQYSDIPWKSVKRILKKPTLIVIFSTATHGFILSNRILGKQRPQVLEYVLDRINR